MSIQNGTYNLGPGNGTLSVKTKRTGAAAKAGHDLVIHVTSWEATLEVGEDLSQTTVTLDADGASLRVREGTGGMQKLGEDDKSSIHKSIDDDVLKRRQISFRSTGVQATADGSKLAVQGELTLVGQTRPVEFDLAFGADGELTGSALVKQSNWGIKPYSTLFGALKVADDVELELELELDASLPGA
jgi:polyisoprenoid-binding protein YceI